MENKRYIEFLEIYIARLKRYERYKEESGAEVEIDALNTWIEFNLHNIRTVVSAIENNVRKRR